MKSIDSVIQSHEKNLHGVVVLHQGEIVAERYFHGEGPQDAHHVASVTKSVVSALVGIAIDAGFIKSLDQRVLDFFPEYQADPMDFLKRSVTIRQLLTMTAPFPFSWNENHKQSHEPLDRLRRQKDWETYILQMMGSGGRSGEFQYCTAGTHLLSAILTRTTGMCAREFANERLFGPLGMRVLPDYEMCFSNIEDVFGGKLRGWAKDPAGNSIGGWGLTMTFRDMARFGSLYLNKGLWEEKRIISDAWVRESTSPSSKEYGYLWWLQEIAGHFSFSALGSGGYAITCIPDKELVIALRLVPGTKLFTSGIVECI
jgi:CubicO group peptidase (beta-lactamase class C family)